MTGLGRSLGVLCALCGFMFTACTARPIFPSPTPAAVFLTPTFLPPPSSVPSAVPSVSSVDLPPRELTVCLTAEPQSLYLYARPESGRADILAALNTAPDALLDNARGELVMRDMTLKAGDTVVDELGRVVTLTAGVTVNLLDGAQAVFDGATPITAPQMVVTFRLRPGMLWSDGAPLTADDSVFSFEVSRSPDSFDPRRALAERTAAYRAPDALTVEWTGQPGFIDPTYFANFWTPLPRHIFAGLTPTQIADDERATRAPLGWGPFVLREWARGDHLTFERNPYYFRAAEGLPWADTVTYRFAFDVRCDVIPRSAAPVEVEGLTPLTAEGNALVHLDFNLAPAEGDSRFTDVDARQAIAFCLDRAAFAADVPATYWPAADLAPIPFDPAQGRALLTQPLTLTLAYGAQDEALAFAIEGQLESNCGIGIEPHPLTRGELEGDWPDGVVFGRRFDLALFTWTVGSVPPCELWTTVQIGSDANPGGANDTGYSNSDFDAACHRALTSLDPAQAALYHAEAQRILARDLPMLPLFFRAQYAAVRPTVRGFAFDPAAPTSLWNIEAFALTP